MAAEDPYCIHNFPGYVRFQAVNISGKKYKPGMDAKNGGTDHDRGTGSVSGQRA